MRKGSAKALFSFSNKRQAGTGLTGGVRGATPPIVVCPSINFGPFGKNHFLEVSSSEVTP